MDIVYLKTKKLTLEEFNHHKKNIEQEEPQEIKFHEHMTLGYCVSAEDYILGGEEINAYPLIIDLENQEMHELTFDENKIPTFSQEQLDEFEIYAYEDAEEGMINWYQE